MVFTEWWAGRGSGRGSARRGRCRAARRGDGAGRAQAPRRRVRPRGVRARSVLAPEVARLRGFRPALAPEPFEMLVGAITAQQISLKAARGSESLHRALRRSGRARLCVSGSGGRRRRLTRGSHQARLLARQGPIRPGARTLRPRPGFALAPVRRRGQGRAHEAPGNRRVDGRLVPRSAPRETSRLARRRPRPAVRGLRALW